MNKTNDELREALAAYAHEAWSGWMSWMFEHGGQVVSHVDGASHWVMLPEKYERWQRQMNTEFSQLPDGEKKSDYDEADKILAVIDKILIPWLTGALDGEQSTQDGRQ